MPADPLSELMQRLDYEPVRVSGGNTRFAALSTAFLLTLVPRIGKPLLPLTRRGMELPAYGFIPWQAVRKMDLEPLKARYGSTGHMLDLEVPSLPGRVTQMHPATRLLYRMSGFGRRRTLISIRLVRTSIPADELFALTQYLWRTACSADQSMR